MATRSNHCLPRSNKSPSVYTRFSDYKHNTLSTAQRHAPDSSSSDSSTISQFTMLDAPKEQQIKILIVKKHQNNPQLTFASITYKKNLLKRLNSFIDTITVMLINITVKKNNRRLSIHNKIIPSNNKPKQKKMKLTFQMINCYLKKDYLYTQLTIQQKRLTQVKKQLKQMYESVYKTRGGFSEYQIIQLMNIINRIQEYCVELYNVVDQLQQNQKLFNSLNFN